MKLPQINQKGVAPILLLLAVVGLIGFLVIANLVPFKDKMLGSLFPKPQSHAAGAFLSALGKSIVVNGAAIRVNGYNYHWLGTNCEIHTDAQLDQAFSQIRNNSKGNIVRTPFYQSGSNNGGYGDFDRYIAAAKRNGLYLLPMLVNEWKDCEPSTNSMKWLPWYQSGYKQTGDGYPVSFRDYAARLATRYANEPTIAWWQLVNEPDGRNSDNSCSETQAANALRVFADDMVGVIKAIDHNHMVDLGAISWCGGQGSSINMVNAGLVDLIDLHHDYSNNTVGYPSGLSDRINAISSLNKPYIVGEAGICADVNSTGGCSGTVNSISLAQRATFFDAKLRELFNHGGVGYIIWQQGTLSNGWDVGPGDPTEAVMAKYALTLATPIPTPTQTLVPTAVPTLLGDTDKDGKVDIFDYNNVMKDYGKTGSGLLGDTDKNGSVDIFDYNNVLKDYGKTS